MHSAVIDIDNNDPESLRRSEIIFLVQGFFFFKYNCVVLCDTYPLRVF